MEMWTLASHNALNFLKESLTIRSDDIQSKSFVISNLLKNGQSKMPKVFFKPTYELFKAYLSLLGIELEDQDVFEEQEE